MGQRKKQTANVYEYKGRRWVQGKQFDYLESVEKQWGPLVRKYAARFDLPEDLVYAVISHESSGRIDAVSHANAKGLMQLTPITQREMGVKNPFDPEENVRGGTGYLRKMLNQFGDLTLALAAYNWGPTNLVKNNYRVPQNGQTDVYIRKIRYGPRYDDAIESAENVHRVLNLRTVGNDPLAWSAVPLHQIQIPWGEFAAPPVPIADLRWGSYDGQEVPANDPPFWGHTVRDFLLLHTQAYPGIRIHETFDWDNPVYNGIEWRINPTVPHSKPIRVWQDQLGFAVVEAPWLAFPMRLLMNAPQRPLMRFGIHPPVSNYITITPIEADPPAPPKPPSGRIGGVNRFYSP